MAIKKTLITTIHTDVSEFSDPLIEAYKAFIKAGASPDQRIEFEVVTQNEESVADRLLRLVRSEFKVNDEGKESDEASNEQH